MYTNEGLCQSHGQSLSSVRSTEFLRLEVRGTEKINGFIMDWALVMWCY